MATGKVNLGRLRYVVNAGDSLEITGDLPPAYIMVARGSSAATLAVYAGVGYGASATRHKISTIISPTNERITATPTDSRYGVIVNNSSDTNATITITPLM